MSSRGHRRARGRTAPRRRGGAGSFAGADGRPQEPMGWGRGGQNCSRTRRPLVGAVPRSRLYPQSVELSVSLTKLGPESRDRAPCVSDRAPRAPPQPLPRVHASRSAPCRAAGAPLNPAPRPAVQQGSAPRSRSGSGWGARPRPARVPETPPGPGPLDASGSTVQSLLPRDLPPLFLNVRLGLVRGCRYVAFQKEYFHLQ